MSLEKFTGLNVSKARDDIFNFAEALNNATEKGHNAFNSFFEVLEANWASENAASYTQRMMSDINIMAFDLYQTSANIIHGAVEAAQVLASANGSTFNTQDLNNDPENMNSDIYYFVGYSCKTSINNIVGMDTETVRIALDVFEKGAKEFLNLLDSAPESIAFYDTDGNMINTYSRSIRGFKDKFSELITSFVNDMKKYIRTETDNILLAKQKATDIMNG